ncbi:MAG: GWxTD domain-containing protein [Candidatus Marinimicrobia bacterium]|nr:GWxTD domain-containing protein [Candidatus Neomarinimicrobiota bacterium]
MLRNIRIKIANFLGACDGVGTIKNLIITVMGITVIQGVSLFSQNTSFRVELDFAQFRYSQEFNYLEIYYSFNESRLTYKLTDGQFHGGIYLHVSLPFSKDSVNGIDEVWRIPHTVVDTIFSDTIAATSIIGVIGLAIPIGKHQMSIEILDQNDSSRRYESSFTILKKNFYHLTPILSGIELCTSINRNATDQESVFYKNTLEVIPNPGRLYGSGKPRISYYIEAYNLVKEGEFVEYTTRAVIYDSDGNEVLFKELTKLVKNESSVEIGNFTVGMLQGGTYELQFILTNKNINKSVSVKKKFYVHDPDQGLRQILLSDIVSEYSSMSEDDLDLEFQLAGYIAIEEEKIIYKGLLSIDEKRNFMYKFWKRRDPTPNTIDNELKERYMSLAEMAKIRYSIGPKEGWKTDRGRVLILYGPPNEIERFSHDIQINPYEIWYYHQIQGGVIFVFADLFGFNDYILLHSTHRNELRDVNWRSQIETN